ncbi:MAG: hypothetical protein GX251_03570 [Firmicutes bacterium]|nr:hypothetical protein [Bacillota bacterium]
MESLLQELKGTLDAGCYGVLEQIAGYIDAHYVMDVLFDGVDEIKFRRSGRTLLTVYVRGESLTALVIFGQREGQFFAKAREKHAAGFSGAEYDLFLRAFDNKTRLDRLKRLQELQTSRVP